MEPFTLTIDGKNHGCTGDIFRTFVFMAARLEAAEAVIKTVDWIKSEDTQHGEDCEYWDWEKFELSGEPCVCGLLASREAIKKYEEIHR